MMINSSDLLEQILKHGPSQGTIFLVLTAMKKDGRTSEVIQGCLKALDIYPADIDIRKLLAESYLDAGLIGQAEAELDKVVFKIDELVATYKLQAQVYARQKRFEKSFESLKRYLTLCPDDQEGLDLLDKVKPAEAKLEPEEAPSMEAVEPEPEEPAIEMLEPTPEILPEVEPIEEEPVEEEVAPEPVIEPAAEAVEAEPEESAIEMLEPEPPEEVAQAEAIEEGLEEAVVDLATPTLAELYFNQGLIQEAINTYEKVLSNDPDDKASEQRLAELKASIEPEAKPLVAEGDIVRAKTEKTIAVLENWLSRIQDVKNG